MSAPPLFTVWYECIMPNSTIESFVRDAPKSTRSTGESSCSKLARTEENISISKKEATREHWDTIERNLEMASFCVATTNTFVFSFSLPSVFPPVSEELGGPLSSSKEDSFLGNIK